MLGVRMVAGHCGKQSEEKNKPPEALSGCMEQASNRAGACRTRGAQAGAAGLGVQSLGSSRSVPQTHLRSGIVSEKRPELPALLGPQVPLMRLERNPMLSAHVMAWGQVLFYLIHKLER